MFGGIRPHMFLAVLLVNIQYFFNLMHKIQEKKRKD